LMLFVQLRIAPQNPKTPENLMFYAFYNIINVNE